MIFGNTQDPGIFALGSLIHRIRGLCMPGIGIFHVIGHPDKKLSRKSKDFLNSRVLVNKVKI